MFKTKKYEYTITIEIYAENERGGQVSKLSTELIDFVKRSDAVD